MTASKKIASDILLFGLFWICIFGDWHTVRAFGDDASIYLVDFDETAYDLYLKGYYPTDYTYSDFRRDSIESMTSHYVATDSNNFSAIVDTIEQDVLLNGWSVIDNFFEDAWINLKLGDITVARGFTDDFKHTLNSRFKTSPASSDTFERDGHTWVGVPYQLLTSSGNVQGTVTRYTVENNWPVEAVGTLYASRVGNNWVVCSWILKSNYPNGVRAAGSQYTYGLINSYYNFYDNNSGSYIQYLDGYISGYKPNIVDSFSSRAEAESNFYSAAPPSSDPVWNGTGYYSNISSNYNINLPALPYIDWSSISNNNKTKYGIDFPDIDLTVDFQLPDSYYPQSVTYDTPYWLYNTDSTPVDWVNVSFEDVTLPDVQMSDGDGSFFQALFGTLPLAFVPILLGVILCYLIFLML